MEKYYLRLSIIDKCNFRCSYCIPKNKIQFLPKKEILTYEEHLTIIEIFGKLGVDSIRITGGEPLLRSGIEKLISGLQKNSFIKDISLTTNGSLLLEKLENLKEAGLNRLNISLDTLTPEKFSHITQKEKKVFFKILDGLDYALKLDFKPLKINTVLLKGINDNEIDDFISFSERKGVSVRFIELMNYGNCNFFKKHSLGTEEIKAFIEKKYGKLLPAKIKGEGPSENFIVPGTTATIGFIYSNSHRKCEQCNRLRLSADGQLRLCLFSKKTINLKLFLREKFKHNPKLLEDFLSTVLNKKHLHNHQISTENYCLPNSMHNIGG